MPACSWYRQLEEGRQGAEWRNGEEVRWVDRNRALSTATLHADILTSFLALVHMDVSQLYNYSDISLSRPGGLAWAYPGQWNECSLTPRRPPASAGANLKLLPHGIGNYVLKRDVSWIQTTGIPVHIVFSD